MLSKEEAYKLRRELDPKFDIRIRKVTAKAAMRKSRVKLATPLWFDDWHKFVWMEASHIRNLREQATGIKWHIDHIIPLKAKTALGLHVAENWQVIPSQMNVTKSNRLKITTPFEWIAHL